MNNSKTELYGLSESVQQVFSIKEHLVDKDLEQLERRLNKTIEDVKTDLNKRIDRSEARLKLFIGIAVSIGSIATSGIITLIIALLK